MNTGEISRAWAGEAALPHYWQKLSQRLRLPETVPARTVLPNLTGVPLEEPVSLSLRRLMDAECVDEAPDVLQAHAGGQTYTGYLRRQVPDGAPRAIVSPRTEQELVAIMLWAAQRDIEILPWGFGTDPYCEKATKNVSFIVVKLDHMKRFLEFDEERETLKVQAGATWQEIAQLAQQHGLMRGKMCLHNPSTLGGSLAVHPTQCQSPRYGTLADDLVQLRMITPSGPLNVHGPLSETKDLLGFVLGSRGSLGIITEVTLQLHREPSGRAIVWAHFSSRKAAILALREIAYHHHHHLITARLVDGETISFLHRSQSSQRIFSPRALFNGSSSTKVRLVIQLAGSPSAVSRTRRHIEEILRAHETSLEGNGRGAGVDVTRDGLWHYYQPLWRELWHRNLIVHRLTTLVPWETLPQFIVPWEDALRSVLLSTSGVSGLPLTTVHAMRRHALVDTLLLGHQAAGDIELKFQQLERIQAVAQEIRRRWNVAFESSSLANKALQAARRALDPLDVMLH